MQQQKLSDEALKALLHSEVDKIIMLGSDGLTEEDAKVFLDAINPYKNQALALCRANKDLQLKCQRAMGIVMGAMIQYATGRPSADKIN